VDPAYTAIAVGLKTFVLVMGWDVRISGASRIPRQGPVVIATNHVGHLDWLPVGLAAWSRGRSIRILARRELWHHPVAGVIMRAARHIPVDRYGSPDGVVEEAVRRLRAGEVVLLFPESVVSRSFVPAPGKTGAARIAMAAGVPLIPGAVWGTQRFATVGRPTNWQRGMALTVDLDEPVPYAPGDDPTDVTRRLMARIGEMVQAAADRYPQRPANRNDRWWLPAHAGGSAPTVEESAAMASRDHERRRRARARQP
jgi:1-acyl-sn-glycerol-3-phosphate acyltransferase